MLHIDHVFLVHRQSFSFFSFSSTSWFSLILILHAFHFCSLCFPSLPVNQCRPSFCSLITILCHSPSSQSAMLLQSTRSHTSPHISDSITTNWNRCHRFISDSWLFRIWSSIIIHRLPSSCMDFRYHIWTVAISYIFLVISYIDFPRHFIYRLSSSFHIYTRISIPFLFIAYYSKVPKWA